MNTGPANETARIGRYEIIRRIGQGGMAEVFLGRTVGPGGIAKRVCIKRIRPEAVADPRALERFSQEARTSFELQHANIVTVFDFGRDGQELFLALEWIDGCDLATLLRSLRREGQTLPPILAAHVTAAVAKALAYAHDHLDQRGHPAALLHRDVTPSNILLSRRGEVLLTDFGIARALGKEGAPAGTPAYMAPEQARGEPGDARSDLYALGLVLVEMLVGQRLRSEGSFEAARLPVTIPALTEVPGPLAEVARALLQPEPSGRPASAGEVSRALASTLAEEVLRGRPLPEQSLAQLVQKAAPPDETPTDSAGPPTEAGVTVAAPSAAAEAPRRHGLRWALLAGGVAIAGLLVGSYFRGAGSGSGSGSNPPRPSPTILAPAPPPTPATPAPQPATPPPAPAAPRRRPGAATAQLRVTAPGSWVTVYLDGQKLGDEAGLFRIPAGRHQLRVTNPPLRFERSLTIDARAGETLEYEFHPGR